MSNVHADLLEKIYRCLDRTGMSREAFGRGAINDWGLISDLENNRELKRRTESRVLAFIETCLSEEKGAA
ncbi:hypothetical protein [Cereibacter azotoformans]|uniref:hypothetical protein n=1 Tax=Cereibacter azotoformans TaxID=43057 RepID=UPI00117A430C|nr:hypothetical protein [Cereibacter azotoformans]